ncbi:ankyrin repeat domain-containing protein [Clostridium sp. DJ247]|uniref:ankyrin repeat domain-containing protein n=1 Tax=Clostridium sp. DJ247 TaxID=2726188 RepID=UPI0016283960|nr:ankyrin repeat domain-containing protein [Clostridium sp. DJ247]MBC2582746.1 ankyrin repeat domain-containing protein [Clostridium sp. DJ247]
MNNNTKDIDIFSIIRNGDEQLYKSYIENIDINIRNEYKQSLLHEAITVKRSDIAFDLLNRGIDVNIQDYRGQTALHFICFHPNISLAKEILEKGGDINIRDSYGNNALWSAVFNCKGRYYEIVELFMKYNPDINTKNNAGRSPLDFAIQTGFDKLINLLKG